MKPTAQPRPQRIPRLVHKYTRIIVEADIAPVRPTILLLRADHDSMTHVAATDLDGSLCSRREVLAERALFLDHDHDLVACVVSCRLSKHVGWEGGKKGGVPMPAGFLRFSTITHSTSAAPELSMQVSID